VRNKAEEDEEEIDAEGAMKIRAVPGLALTSAKMPAL